jgi:iron complex transport system permease protein
LLPLATVLGGSLLLLADCLARRIAAPIEIPVGVATALLGVPLLLWLLGRSR